MVRHRLPTVLMPGFWSIISTALTILLLFVLQIVARYVEVPLLNAIVGYAINNIHIIFLISVLTGYAEYLYRFKKTVAIVAPLLGSFAGILIIIFVFGLIDTVNHFYHFSGLSHISTLVQTNIILLFLIFLFFGYMKYLMNLLKAILRH